jgi:hypothetical protein
MDAVVGHSDDIDLRLQRKHRGSPVLVSFDDGNRLRGNIIHDDCACRARVLARRLWLPEQATIRSGPILVRSGELANRMYMPTSCEPSNAQHEMHDCAIMLHTLQVSSRALGLIVATVAQG